MKKIDKYIRHAETPSFGEELKQYRIKSQAFRQNSSKKTAKKFSPLSLIIPFAAASLSPFAINAQCGTALITAGPGAGPDGQHWHIDLDADGDIDFELDASHGPGGTDDLFIGLRAGSEVLASPVGGGFFYADRLANGDPVSSANGNWRGTGTLPNGAMGIPQATLDYQSNGNWHGATAQTGFLGVRLDGNRVGFIQVTWNNQFANPTIDIDAGTMGVETISPTSVGAGDCLALPVELTRLEGTMFSDYAELEWATASEEDNKGFKIQRSTDGEIFKTVGFVDGQGYSSTNIDYNFQDKNIRKGVDYYYRIKQIDFWGRSEASEVINLKALEGPQTVLTIAPNPANGDFVNIQYQSAGNEVTRLSVFDARGKVLITKTLNADDRSNFDLDIHNLPSGSYFLKMEEADAVEYRQFVKS